MDHAARGLAGEAGAESVSAEDPIALFAPDNADAALLLLGIAALNPARADIGAGRAQLLLEPWAVQAALRRRRGGNRLDDKECGEIRRCTSDRMMSEDSPPDDSEVGDVGYRKPPRAMRFAKGQSGNPAGRPRGRRRQAPYEAVLGQVVKIREGGAERRVTAAEAFLLQLMKRALEGDDAAARASLAVIQEARERQRRRPVSDQRHRVGGCGARERHICARATANGEETRSLSRDCSDGPRTVACRSSVGPSLPATQSLRSTHYHRGHSQSP
jgi:hypothetical protein